MQLKLLTKTQHLFHNFEWQGCLNLNDVKQTLVKIRIKEFQTTVCVVWSIHTIASDEPELCDHAVETTRQDFNHVVTCYG